MTAIDTPGTAPFDESVTTPVIVPRSLCATATNGRARTTAATNDAVKRVKLMIPPQKRKRGDCGHVGTRVVRRQRNSAERTTDFWIVCTVTETRSLASNSPAL